MADEDQTTDERLEALEQRVAHLEALLDEETRKLAAPYVASEDQVVGLIGE